MGERERGEEGGDWEFDCHSWGKGRKEGRSWEKDPTRSVQERVMRRDSLVMAFMPPRRVIIRARALRWCSQPVKAPRM